MLTKKLPNAYTEGGKEAVGLYEGVTFRVGGRELAGLHRNTPEHRSRIGRLRDA